ncbi:hypothetical protein PR202_ga01666 [Eleusine coracana subsp. coracana]|uniref:Uncharacterized protein n=1 Tax=Eleusine coracana subsp. coracana TaxID=191504 RepID=A0AAV5BHF2_ELECO|nr:hypothetical protein PR202_ga00979 [Eleusine coracana subsp. coracana]GJM85861.1 hypothetical protein PR202_ga01666 [Eleusine coracana subsp. coracana]
MRDACVLQRLVPLVEAAVADVCRNGTSVPRSVGIADLGCSSGPNALFFVSAVVDAVRRRCKTSTELRVFLNDLPSDDFNAVFRQIPAFLQRLHWLSQVPRELSTGELENRGNICAGRTSSPAVIDAYARQFSRDLTLFLASRAAGLHQGTVGQGSSQRGMRRVRPPQRHPQRHGLQGASR